LEVPDVFLGIENSIFAEVLSRNDDIKLIDESIFHD
jgi:hypothetical protein